MPQVTLAPRPHPDMVKFCADVNTISRRASKALSTLQNIQIIDPIDIKDIRDAWDGWDRYFDVLIQLTQSNTIRRLDEMFATLRAAEIKLWVVEELVDSGVREDRYAAKAA